MFVRSGNLWDHHAAGAWVGITTNGIVKRNGTAVMGKGVAQQAALRFPDLPRQLGAWLQTHGNHVAAWSDARVITFPTKHHWQQPSDLDLIARSASELMGILDTLQIEAFVLPRPGCGLGQLPWDSVAPVLAPIFDARVVILTPQIGAACRTRSARAHGGQTSSCLCTI